MVPSRNKKPKSIATITHTDASRTNIPTSEDQPVLSPAERHPMAVAFQRRHTELDPQLVWHGKDMANYSDLVVPAPPLWIQEKVHPKALIDDLVAQTEARREETEPEIPDLFGDFNGLPEGAERTDFYQHDGHWTNRLILGDSLHVMASLAEREGLRGKVQCIYLDPPYGIKFNSNFQWSTTSRDVKDGKAEHITREPEQVKAFRDTWKEGIHSYLTYLRDRLTVARDLLTESGSIFVQIGDENVHRVRAVMDEVFGEGNFVNQVTFRVKSPLQVSGLARTTDFLIWYGRDKESLKFRQFRVAKSLEKHPEFALALLLDGTVLNRGMVKESADARWFTAQNLASSGYTTSCMYVANVEGRSFDCPKGKSWKTSAGGMGRLYKSSRLQPLTTSLRWRYFFDDAPSEVITDIWQDTFAASDKTYVVQTNETVIQRCLLMTTDPGDLVLDPTCGSGTTAYVAEQWGRRWITIDTSRVALALARARIMGARYPYYLLADSPEGQQKEAQITGARGPSTQPTYGNIRQGFVYERVPHITLKAIANNAEIDILYEKHQPAVEAALAHLNGALQGHSTPFPVTTGGRKGQLIDFTATGTVTMASGETAPANGFMEWEVPRQGPAGWPRVASEALERFWQARIKRQQAMDNSIAAKADFEYLYDKPYEDKGKVRVAGPFTVESLSPHREIGNGENGGSLDPVRQARASNGAGDFTHVMLEELGKAGIQQMHKDQRIKFRSGSLSPWPGPYVDGVADLEPPEGQVEAGGEQQAAILIGPEFGTMTRTRLVEAAREAAEMNAAALICCAFAYDPQATDMGRYGSIPIIKARMNADLHMPLANNQKTGRGSNLFVVFGEPDILLFEDENDPHLIRVKVNGTDIYDPQKGEVRSHEPDELACWFIDTNYNQESFFVRHAYFLGASDPYKNLRTTLKAEIDADAWATLKSETSRPFHPPSTGRIAVKVINHLGDEVMKVLPVQEKK